MIDGATKKHFIYSLNVDTGAINSGWPVDVNATATYNGTSFTSLVQNERAALALVNGIVYVPYSGHAGDCGTYRGWVVGVRINNPASVTAWATSAIGGGIWGHGGVASDGTNMFAVTGNTFNTGGNWSGGEAIIRLQAGPIFQWRLRPTTGRLLIGSHSIIAIPTLAAAAQCSSMYPVRRLHSWRLRWAKMATPIY